MAAFPRKDRYRRRLLRSQAASWDPLRLRLRHWQQVRTWARLIREAEALWHVDVRELKRLGALELSQLLEEVPPAQRQRVNRWLRRYAVATRLQDHDSVAKRTDRPGSAH
ncbi:MULTISPECIES: hypothetical protein [unclassified Synechococcus]|jgi:hypothetical protein|uniref:hypothetical protein n=1 Tax=unclassified Synechococcus TaxID=2626047 RepID=UPI001F101144|nr:MULTISPECIES: hypothetical protein [unclassified Synechococcus]